MPASVAVCSRSFSRHELLRSELVARVERATFNDAGASLAGAELVEFLRGHEATIVGLEVIDDSVLTQVPEVRVVGKYGVGLDMLDLDALERHHVRLGWTPGVNRRSVAELSLSFILAVLHRVPESSSALRGGAWTAVVGRELSGLTVGFLGFGQVARDLATLLGPFGCELLAHDIAVAPEVYRAAGVTGVSLDVLLDRSDVVSVHLPLNDATEGILDERRLRAMRRGAVLVNTARGGLVDEKALAALLAEGHLAGAAFDVFDREPPTDRALLDTPTFLGSPHIGSSTEQAILAMGRAAIDGLGSGRLPSELGLVRSRGR